MSFLKSILLCNCLFFYAFVFGYWMLNCTALAEEVQLCMVKPPPVCYKFFLFNCRGTALVLYVGMVKNYHGVNKNVLLYFVLCRWELRGWVCQESKTTSRREGFVECSRRKMEFEVLKERKVEDGFTIPILSINTAIFLFNFYCWCILLRHASWIVYEQNGKRQEG